MIYNYLNAVNNVDLSSSNASETKLSKSMSSEVEENNFKIDFPNNIQENQKTYFFILFFPKIPLLFVCFLIL